MKNFAANTDITNKQMLEDINVKSIDELFDIIPEKARILGLNLPEGLSEMETQRTVKAIADKNKTDYACFLGAGAYKRFIPACVSQISQRFEFNTAYTPYQPEISQGTLQVIYEFQSMICDLTKMDVSNASIYDGATACAEAILMSNRITSKNKVLVSKCINPEYIEVIKTYAQAADIDVDYISCTDYKTDLAELKSKLQSNEYASFLIQMPNFYGSLEDIESLKAIKETTQTLMIACVDPISLVALKKPGIYGADIAVGDIQSLGNPVSFGGPYAGFITTIDKYKRQLPGRIVGRTLDADSNQAFTLTLQAREQHIRREKATSNICSNQALVILNSTVYMSVMGKTGLNQVAYLSSKNAHMLAEKLQQKGYKVLNKDFFNEFVLQIDNADDFIAKMKEKGILAGFKLDDNKILVCTTELNSDNEIDKYIVNA